MITDGERDILDEQNADAMEAGDSEENDVRIQQEIWAEMDAARLEATEWRDEAESFDLFDPYIK